MRAAQVALLLRQLRVIGREILALVLPGGYVRESRLPQQGAELRGRVLVRAFGMDALARLEAAGVIGPGYRQVACRFEMHLDARFPGIEERNMTPLAKVEICRQQAIDVAQQVFIERRRDARRVVVSGFEHGDVLDQVDSEQQTACLALRRVGDMPQKAQRLIGLKVAEARTRVEKHPIMLSHRVGQDQTG